MPRGKIVDAPAARPFRPPERAGAADGSPEELAKRRVEDAVRAGYEEGLRRGREEAEQQLAEQLIAVRESLARSTAELHGLADRMLELVKDEIVGLALQIASRVVRDRIEAGDPIVTRIADEMLARLGEGVRCRIRVHPDDREALASMQPELEKKGLVELVVDPTVGRGGLIAEAGEEELDARLGTAYQALWEAVMDGR